MRFSNNCQSGLYLLCPTTGFLVLISETIIQGSAVVLLQPIAVRCTVQRPPSKSANRSVLGQSASIHSQPLSSSCRSIASQGALHYVYLIVFSTLTFVESSDHQSTWRHDRPISRTGALIIINY